MCCFYRQRTESRDGDEEVVVVVRVARDYVAVVGSGTPFVVVGPRRKYGVAKRVRAGMCIWREWNGMRAE